MKLSVVLPVYNEEATVPELHRRLLAALEPLGPFEMIYVDDGSTDRSKDSLRELALKDPRVGVLVLSRNFGHQVALTAGLDHARGDAVILMDSDLQDPPEVIPDLVKRWREGFDVVYAQRRARQGESLFKRATAYLFYRLVRLIATIDVPPDTGDFRLLSRRAADGLRSLRERRRFLRGLVVWGGFRQTKILYDRQARSLGESKYRLGTMIRLAMTAAFSFSGFPIFLLGCAGLLVCVGALVALAIGAASGATVALFFLGGVQLLGLWVLGQYLGAVSEEVRQRPLYFIQDAMNLQSSPAKDA
ncbi:MAG: glycosyltransferase family 2 protein [Vicinamibacteria bacterium]